MTVGIVGDGKSTWSKMKVESNSSVSIVSKDSIREMLHGKYVFDETLEPMVNRIHWNAIVEVLSTGRSLIIDECHVKKSERAEIINSLRNKFPGIMIVGVRCVNVSRDSNINRRMAQPKITGDSVDVRATWYFVIDEMIRKFEEPVSTEFDNMIYFRS
jgi:predicted kinase